MNTNKKIVAVILTFKPDNRIIRTLYLLKHQSVALQNIYIFNTNKDLFFDSLNDNDKKELVSIIYDYDIKIVNIDRFDHGATRNLILNYLDIDYVLFMTQDAIPFDKNLVGNLLLGFNDDKVKVSYAKQLAYKDAKYTERLVREFNYPSESIIKNKNTLSTYNIKNYFCSNVCCMYDYNTFKEYKGFEEKVLLNEDMLYAYKIINNGYSVYYNAEALVYHSHNFNYIEQFVRNYHIAKVQKQFKHIFKNLNNEKEGFRLYKYVIYSCFNDKRYLSIIDFTIETVFRYLGHILGKML